MSRTYETFVERLHELADIHHAQGLMSWDQETYMPPRGAAMRARAMGPWPVCTTSGSPPRSWSRS